MRICRVQIVVTEADRNDSFGDVASGDIYDPGSHDEVEDIVNLEDKRKSRKTRYILIRTGVIKEAVPQIRLHFSSFLYLISNIFYKNEYPYLWKFYKWLSDQYIIFAQLLHHYSINPSLPDCDRSYYYHITAK